MEATLIQAVNVVRQEDGLWYHPDMPSFTENVEQFSEWLLEQGLQIEVVKLSDEDEAHPVYANYFYAGATNVSGWNPREPDGDGWFMLSIEDTEDGPACLWARRSMDH